MVEPDAGANIRVEKKFWAKHGILGCYGVEDDRSVYRSISYASQVEYFFTGLDSKKCESETCFIVTKRLRSNLSSVGFSQT